MSCEENPALEIRADKWYTVIRLIQRDCWTLRQTCVNFNFEIPPVIANLPCQFFCHVSACPVGKRTKKVNKTCCRVSRSLCITVLPFYSSLDSLPLICAHFRQSWSFLPQHNLVFTPVCSPPPSLLWLVMWCERGLRRVCPRQTEMGGNGMDRSLKRRPTRGFVDLNFKIGLNSVSEC